MNGLPIALSIAVHEDLDQAAEWYEEQRRGLSDALLLDVEAALEAIRERPNSFPAVGARTRRALLKRFPYAIYFQIEMDVIVVIAIVHTARAPGLWKMRRR